jgi:hypothetical protein
MKVITKVRLNPRTKVDTHFVTVKVDLEDCVLRITSNLYSDLNEINFNVN